MPSKREHVFLQLSIPLDKLRRRGRLVSLKLTPEEG
jgi:hypothetical protein